MLHGGTYRGLFKFLAITALLNIAWVVFTISSELPQSLAMRQMRIAVALIISVLPLWPGKVMGLLISWVALLWITLEYILWWKQSVDVLDAAGMSFSNSPHFAYLLQGTWWDLCVLLATVIGLLWAGNYLRRTLYQSRHAMSEEKTQ